jgi:plasmid stabilization system protein ParE
MLSDHEAEEIARGRREGVGGPILLKWVDQLLADRLERIRQLEHLRERLRQAFRYLDGLVRAAQRPSAAPTAAPLCPHCRKPYVRAAGRSPAAIVYVHADGRECRSSLASG